jgi:hypothetical protein
VTSPHAELIARLSHAHPEVLGEVSITPEAVFGGTAFTGLSAVSYDCTDQLYYVLSDDHDSEARFYRLQINLSHNGIQKWDIIDCYKLLDSAGKPYPRYDKERKNADAPDPEGIVVDRFRRVLYWSSEGVVTDAGQQNPSLRIAGFDGKYLGEFTVPSNFAMSAGRTSGPRNNASLEGLGLSPDGRFLYATLELPLYEDGEPPTPTSGALTRITVFDLDSRKALRQWAYPLDPFPTASLDDDGLLKPAWQYNGIADIIGLSSTAMLVLERAVSSRVGVRVYLAEADEATDVHDMESLRGTPLTPLRKTLVVNLASIPGLRAENFEGMTFGPKLTDGRQSMLFVSDNDHDPARFTHILAMAI